MLPCTSLKEVNTVVTVNDEYRLVQSIQVASTLKDSIMFKTQITDKNNDITELILMIVFAFDSKNTKFRIVQHADESNGALIVTITNCIVNNESSIPGSVNIIPKQHITSILDQDIYLEIIVMQNSYQDIKVLNINLYTRNADAKTNK